jgi:hypothetical protein
MAKRTRCGTAGKTRVQSLIFDKGAWSTREARAWARAHGFVAPFVDDKPNTLRIRQVDPTGACAYRTVTFGKGIKAVVEAPRAPAHIERALAEHLAQRTARTRR